MLRLIDMDFLHFVNWNEGKDAHKLLYATFVKNCETILSNIKSHEDVFREYGIASREP